MMNNEVPGLHIPEKDVCHYRVHLSEPSIARAKSIQAIAQEIALPWTKEYIWQEEAFCLKLVDDQNEEDEASGLEKPGVYLAGKTKFGDCIEDEWFIVWILTTLSVLCADVFIQITDTDGEFLLIESAMHLPRWLDPDTATNRAWIVGGKVVIIPPTPTQVLNKQCPDLSLQQAISHLRTRKEVLQSEAIQNDALARIKAYPEQTRREVHRVQCSLPRVLATLLHQDPSLISVLSIACYNRDDLQAATFHQAPRKLSVAEVSDQVDVTVKFTRTLYAQLAGTRFTVPSWYPASTTPEAALVTGCKLVCGVALANDGRLDAALDGARKGLASDTQLAAWREESDKDDYLHVNFDELEDVLAGTRDANTSKNDESDGTIKKMVEQMQKFMTSESTFEGAEFSGEDDDGEDDLEVHENDNDDFDDFDDNDEDDDDDDDEEDGFGDKDADFMQFLRSSVAGNAALDALRKPPAQARQDTKQVESDADDDEDDDESVGGFKDYMAAMDAELSSHGLASREPVNKKGKERATLHESNDIDGGEEDDEDEALQIDFAMAKNMLDSLQSSGGMSGPAAGLLGRMGITLPRNDDDDDDDVEPLD